MTNSRGPALSVIEDSRKAMQGFFAPELRARFQGPWGFLQMNSYTYSGQHMFGHYAATPEVGARWIEFDEASTEKDPMQFVRQVDHFSDCILRTRPAKTAWRTCARWRPCTRLPA